MQFAYLVPRKVNGSQTICLDISYRGLIKLATDTGVIKAMKAELVYENDDFTYNGFHKEPELKANPFKDRGGIVGVYAMALLVGGGVLVETMTIDEVDKIRNDSEAYKSAAKDVNSWKYQNNVWVKYYTEMIKKTVIKRAYKTLPTSKGTEILGTAIDVINEHEGINFDEPEKISSVAYTDDELKEYDRCVHENDWMSLSALCRSLDPEAQQQLRATCFEKPERGMIGKVNAQREQLLKEGGRELDEHIVSISQEFDTGNDIEILLEDLSEWVLDYICDHVSGEIEMEINGIRNRGGA